MLKKWKKRLKIKMHILPKICRLGSLYLVFAVLFFGSLACTQTAQAQEKLESDNYQIQFPGFNSGAGVPSSTNYSVGSTIGQAIQGIFSSSGYQVRAGFQYINTIIPFTFEISDFLIDFGTLTPSTPVTDQATITIKAGGAGGYSVKAIEETALKRVNDTDTIPDTQCDSGSCNETTAQTWTSASTYGFGYNMDGDDVPATFSTTDHYRPFPNASTPESPATVMTKSQVTWDHPNNTWPWESEATITYKVNVSGTQPAGNYQAVITFIAIPSY